MDAIECEIRSAGYRRIAIQSSDVESATTLSTELSKRFSSDTDKRELYVLGDVFIGSCCTDLIASRRCAAGTLRIFPCSIIGVALYNSLQNTSSTLVRHARARWLHRYLYGGFFPRR